MPVRLLVAEEQAEEADRILKNSDQLSPEEQGSTFPLEPAREERQEERGNKNPWEILAIASLFFFPRRLFTSSDPPALAAARKHDAACFRSTRRGGGSRLQWVFLLRSYIFMLVVA
jgi:hypothetical protein